MSRKSKRRSDQRRREELRESEAGGPGSLPMRVVEAMRRLRRYGFSYREIKEITGFSLSTIHKYTCMITPEVFYEPGVSLLTKLSRMEGRGIRVPDVVHEPEVPLSVILSRVEGRSITVPSTSNSVQIARPQTTAGANQANSSGAPALPYCGEPDKEPSPRGRENPQKLEETPRLKEAREEVEFWRRKRQAQQWKNEAVRNGAD